MYEGIIMIISRLLPIILLASISFAGPVAMTSPAHADGIPCTAGPPVCGGGGGGNPNDPGDPGKPGGGEPRHLEREACLPAPAGAGEREQPRRRERLAELGDLALPPDQARELRRKDDLLRGGLGHDDLYPAAPASVNRRRRPP